MIDENCFFREATLRICGSLDITKALEEWFFFVKDIIPADEAYLHYYDDDEDVSLFYARACHTGVERINISVQWPAEIRTLARQDKLPMEVFSNRADSHPAAKSALRAVGRGKSSILTVRLTIDGNWIGGVTLLGYGWNRFNKEHLRLFTLLRKPFTIALSNSRRYQALVELKDLLADDKQYLENEIRQLSGEEIVGVDFGLKGVMELVNQVAHLDSPVLLLGETGVGKEVIANALHQRSNRKQGPLIKVNCGALTGSLIDSELFGHEKGSFTGAISRKRGRFERAHLGTIFLDEIGELSQEAQVRLLRVLQEKELDRVGGTEPIKVDIRVIAATQRDLLTMVEKGQFRDDLYFRLQVFPIVIPPLRDRIADISMLVQHFIRKKCREMKLKGIPSLAPNALPHLMAYHWPGNVRELENSVERALILSGGRPLDFSKILPVSAGGRRDSTDKNGASMQLDVVIADHIRKVVEKAQGRIEGKGGAAELLNINPGTLRYRMRKLGIPFGRKANIS